MTRVNRRQTRGRPRLIGAALFLVALLVRLAPMNRYVTPDEPIWVLRSIAFADALAARDIAAIPQTGHPGLTTMAIGALGIRLTLWLQPAAATEHLAWLRNVTWLAPENDAAFDHLAFFLPTGRALVMLITATGVALSYTLGRARLDERTARLLALFLALDPFFGGLSGVLHTDALQATFLLLATLLIIPKRAPTPGAWLNLTTAALCLALAGMTKTLGLLVAPGLALALLIVPSETWGRRVLRVATFTALTLIFYLAMYPPFWVDPRAALASLVTAATYHEGIGLRDVFFAGRMTVDPGPLFYPAVLIFRLTPPVISGLALAIVDPAKRKPTRPGAASVGWFFAPVVLYLAVLTLATKKFDRYALTAMLLLTGIAAIAWARHFIRWKWALLTALLLPWALVAPLPLYYSDPLVGGPWGAQHVVPLGWGEAYSLAAAQLTRTLPDAGNAVALTADVPGTAPYFPGDILSWKAPLAPCADALIAENGSPPEGYNAAGTVRLAALSLSTVYTHQLNLPTGTPLLLPGKLPGAPAGAIAPQTDAATLWAWLVARFPAGTHFLWVHAPDCYPVTESQLAALLHDEGRATCAPVDATAALRMERCVLAPAAQSPLPFRARYAGVLDLIAAAWPETAPSAPSTLAVRLRWRALAEMEELTLYLALRGPDGDIVWAEGGSPLIDDRAWRAPAWEINAFTESTAYIPLSLTVPPGTYTLTLSLSNSSGGWIGATLPEGTFGGTLLELGTVTLVPPRYAAEDVPGLVPPDADFGGLYLMGRSPLPETLWAGERMHFRLGWERRPGETVDTLHWALTCANGARDAGRLPVAVSDPATWPTGHRYETRYAPRTEPLLPDGTCTLSIRVGEAPPVNLGAITIQQRERNFTMAQSPQIPLAVDIGDFARIVGSDLPEGPLAPGEAVDVSLYVEAKKPADRDYTVFVHLVDAEGKVWAQSDGAPVHGAAPTTSWTARQILVDTHSLQLPPEIPDGAYTVFVGLYDAERGGRVPLYDKTGTRFAEDRVPVHTLAVAR